MELILQSPSMNSSIVKSPMNRCAICNKAFTKNANVIRHMRNVHRVKPTLSRASRTLRCALCTRGFTTMKILRYHYEKHHDKKIEVEEMIFQSTDTFTTWKDNMQHETRAMFVVHSGSAKVDCEGKKSTQYYHCHRSGYFMSRGKGKRSLKLQGSNKINAECPAGIRVQRMYNNCLKVEFFKTHVGHSLDLRRINLSESERKDIAAKLAVNVTFETILDDIREGMGDKLERIHLLTRHDLCNIKRDVVKVNQPQPTDEIVNEDVTAGDHFVKCDQVSSIVSDDYVIIEDLAANIQHQEIEVHSYERESNGKENKTKINTAEQLRKSIKRRLDYLYLSFVAENESVAELQELDKMISQNQKQMQLMKKANRLPINPVSPNCSKGEMANKKMKSHQGQLLPVEVNTAEIMQENDYELTSLPQAEHNYNQSLGLRKKVLILEIE